MNNKHKQITAGERTRHIHAEQTRGFFTMAEAAKALGTSRRFLELEATRGRLRVLRLSPRLVRIRQTDWETYLNSAASQ